jgi:hypothetical protein
MDRFTLITVYFFNVKKKEFYYQLDYIIIAMSAIESQTANIKTIDTNRLIINQDVSSVKWNSSKKHENIILLNAGQTSKLKSSLFGSKAILGNTSYTIGVNTDTIKFDIHQGSVLYFGIATEDKDLTSLDFDTKAIGKVFNVYPNTVLSMSLSRTLVSTGPDVYSSKLTYSYEGKTTEVNTTSYNSKVMFPWLADAVNGTGFSVDISRSTALQTFVESNGDVIFTTNDGSGTSRPIRFLTGDNQVIFDNLGFSSIPSITYDIVESSTSAQNGVSNFNMELRVKHPSAPGVSNPGVLISEEAKITASGGVNTAFVENSSGPLILREEGGIDVTIDSTGAITTSGIATVLSLTSNTVRSVSSNNLSLTENSGKGITVADSSGDVTLSSRLSVGDGGDLSSASVLASFNTTAMNQGLVIPTVSDVTIGTIPVIQQVTGMIVFSIADNKFMGFRSGGWVDLSI